MSVKTLDKLILTDDERKQLVKDQEITENIYRIFTNDGYIVDAGFSQKVTIKDLLTLPDVQRFVPQVVTRILHEAREPALVISSIFDRVRLERGQTIQIGAIGAIAVHEVPEGGEYQTSDIVYDSGNMVGLSVRKYGTLLQFTEEMFEDSQWDVIGLWMRAAGRAFARNREQRASLLLNEQGVVYFDNRTPGTAISGVTHGRNIAGAANGSITANDIFDMYAFLAMRNFVPDTLLIHPLAWAVFATDPEMKEVVLENGRLTSRRMPEGGPDPGWGTELNKLGWRTTAEGLGLGSTAGAGTAYAGAPAAAHVPPGLAALGKIGSYPYTSYLSALGATFHVQPRYLPGPLTVLVSPFVPFTASTGASGNENTVATCSLIMLDSNAVGAFIEKTPLTTEEFNDPLRDTRSMKLRERWGLALYEQGKGVVIAKNVVVTRHYNFQNVNNATVTEINDRSAIVT